MNPSAVELQWSFPLLKTLMKETISAPEISLAYLGEFSRFHGEDNTAARRAMGLGTDESMLRLNELVDPHVNRQEFQFSVVRHWTDRFMTTFTGAAGYEFHDDQSVWRLALRGCYRLRPNLKLTLEGEYDSNGQGPNAGTAMKSVWLGLAMDY